MRLRIKIEKLQALQCGHISKAVDSEMAGGIEHVQAQNLVFENTQWQTNSLNAAIRLKENVNRGGYLRHLYMRNISIPNGVKTTPALYTSLPNSPIHSKTVATAAGAVITFDCDYSPLNDNVRTRPPVVSDIHISNIKVGNVQHNSKAISCYQAFVILGPVGSDYNGTAPEPIVLPVKNVSISDCDFGTPANAAQPYFLYHAQGLQLRNVTIAGKVINAGLSAM